MLGLHSLLPCSNCHLLKSQTPFLYVAKHLVAKWQVTQLASGLHHRKSRPSKCDVHSSAWRTRWSYLLDLLCILPPLCTVPYIAYHICNVEPVLSVNCHMCTSTLYLWVDYIRCVFWLITLCELYIFALITLRCVLYLSVHYIRCTLYLSVNKLFCSLLS